MGIYRRHVQYWHWGWGGRRLRPFQRREAQAGAEQVGDGDPTHIAEAEDMVGDLRDAAGGRESIWCRYILHKEKNPV